MGESLGDAFEIEKYLANTVNAIKVVFIRNPIVGKLSSVKRLIYRRPDPWKQGNSIKFR